MCTRENNQSYAAMEQANGNANRFGKAIKVFGGKGALTFQATETRAVVKTINNDAALANAPRQYDWSNKITVQISRAELPVVCGLFAGIVNECKFGSHGPEKNKGYEIQRQQDKVFIKVMQKDKTMVAVPVGPADCFWVAALLTEVLQSNTEVNDSATLLRLIHSNLGTIKK